MTLSDDEETWAEPLEIRLSVHPARPRRDAARRERARGLLSELLALPKEQRHFRVQEERFQDLDLFDLLLEAGHAALPFEGHRAADLLALATILGSLLSEGGARSGKEGLARALCLLATAYRLRGDQAIADRTFVKAGRMAVSGLERGLFARSLALLRWDQGRSEEAIALLRQAGERFAEAGDDQEQAVSQALLGLLLLEEMRTAQATLLLFQATQTLGGERPWLAARAWLGLALGFAAGGEKKKARAARRKGTRLYGAIQDEMARLSLQWLEGQGALLAGDLRDARELLTTVRRKLIAEGSAPEATLATVDLSVLCLRMGWEEELSELIEETAEAFRHDPAVDLIRSALSQLLAEEEAGKLAPQVWDSLVPTLRLLFRIQGLPLRPIPFA
jgi:tetratricopeptide (TPR) repeat protein